jgi:hypothetical protein
VVRSRTDLAVDVLDRHGTPAAVCRFDTVAAGPYRLVVDVLGPYAGSLRIRLRDGERVVGESLYLLVWR